MIGAARAVCFAVFMGALAGELCSVADGETPTPLIYRRVYVPEEDLNTQIRGLLPLKRDEFERRVRAASNRDPAVDKIKNRIEQAVFRARIEGKEVLDGAAELTIVASGQQPSLLSLDPCNLIIHSANWKTDHQRPAVLGADTAGNLHCLVERSGVLNIQWSRAAAVSAADDITFDFQLPMALRRELQITTPTNTELTCESGIVTSTEITGSRMERLWTVELNGEPLTRVSIRTIQPGPSTGPPFIVREATNHAIVGSSIDFETTFTLDVLRGPLQQVEFDVDSAVKVSDVRMGERSIPFTCVSSSSGKPTRIVADCPEPIVGLDQAIEVAATCEWDSSSRWSLPRLHVLNGVYQEGRLTVQAPSWLRLQAQPLRGCVQLQAASTGSGRGSDRFEFQLFESDAVVEISSGQAVVSFSEESAAQITVEPSQITGVMVAELTARGAAPFALTALVPRQWIIDSVETQPPEMLADRLLSTRGSGPVRLQLKMTRPITAQRPVRLVIRAHYRRPANQHPLGSEFFHMASFPDSQGRRRLVSVRVNDPGTELRLAGDENLVRLHPAQLPPTELRLFEGPPGSLLFDAASSTESLTGTLEATSARYRADVFVRADVTAGGGIGHRISLLCQPESSAVGSLLIRLVPRPRGDVQWRLVGEETRDLTAALEGAPDSSANLDSATYRLALPRPQSSPFEIMCQWPESLPSENDVILASLPEAHQQTGIVEVHSSNPSILIQANEVQSLPRPPSLDDHITTLQGRYRYEAGRRGRIAVEQLEPGSVQQGAWAETLRLTSRFSPDGAGEHEASLLIRNAGVAEFSMQFPPTAANYRLVNDNDMEEPFRALGAAGEIRVPLSKLQRRTIVRVRYTSHRPGLGVWPVGRLATPVPRVGLPVLARSWQVHLSPGIEAIAPFATQSLTESGGSQRPLKKGILLESLAGPELGRRLGLLARSSQQFSSNPAFRGWEMLNLELPDRGDATISVYRRGVASTWSACLGLIAASIILRLKEPHRWTGPTVILLAAGAVISEPPLAWSLGWIGFGVLTASGILLFRRQSKNALGGSAGISVESTMFLPVGRMVSAILFLAAIAPARCLYSAPPTGLTSDQTRRAQVVFPIDAMQQPIGEYVYLEPHFYEALHRVADTARTGFPPYLIQNARYRFPVPSAGLGTGVVDIQVSFEIHTFRPATTVTLPLQRDQILLIEGGSRLDGQSATLAWATEGQGLSVVMENPGKHRLEMSLAAIARTVADRMTINMIVPRAAASTVDLPPKGEVSDQVIAIPRQTESADDMRQFYLGGNHLILRWPLGESGTLAAAAEEGGQLLWWKIRPGSVTLDGRFQLRRDGGTAHEATIEVDPRLRLLPGINSESIRQVRVEEGPTNLIRVEMAQPHASEVDFRLSWLWPDASGAGKLVLPRVQLRMKRATHDLTAISAESGLVVNGLSDANGGKAGDEFLRLWADAGPRPDLVFCKSAADQYRAVLVTPRQSIPAVRQLVEWSISRSAARMLGTLELRGVPDTRFEHRVLLPAALKIRQVSLSQSDREAAVRWAQQVDGSLVVTLLESPAPEQTIAIAAELANDQPELRLPAIRLADANYSGSALRVYRRPDVELRVQNVDGWKKDDGFTDDQRRDQGRLVTPLIATDDAHSAQPTIIRTPNRPRVTGKMLVRVVQADGDWRCEANVDVGISNGMLDELRFSIPEELPGPLELEPAMEARIDALAGDRRRELILRPREAMQGHFQLALRGPLHSGATGLQAPDIALVGHRQVDRLVWLDRGPMGERIHWDTTTGLLAAGPNAVASLPADWRDSGGDLYRVIGSHFDATARVQHGSNTLPRVHLAELHAAVSSQRHVSVVALLTIQPAGRKDAAFILPPGCRFVQGMVDGVAAPCTPIGLRAWKIDAPSDMLPYRLTLVYDTFLTVDAHAVNELRFLAPQIRAMEVQRSLWNVRLEDSAPSPSGPRAYVAGRAAELCDQPHAALNRLEASVRALEDVAAAQGPNIPSSVIAENFWRWQHAVNSDRERLVRAAGSRDLATSLASKTQELMERVFRVRQRLIQAGIVDEFDLPPSRSAPTEDETMPMLSLITSGPADELRISWRGQAPTPSPRKATALGLAIFAVLLGSFSRSDAGRTWLLAHSHLALAAGGVGWWLVAPFGWLGWPVLLAAAWLSLRAPSRGSVG